MSDREDYDITVVVGTSDCLREYIKTMISDWKNEKKEIPYIYDRIIDSFDTLKYKVENISHTYSDPRCFYLTSCIYEIDKIKKITCINDLITLDWILDENKGEFVLEQDYLR